jgi:hypothetical protein
MFGNMDASELHKALVVGKQAFIGSRGSISNFTHALKSGGLSARQILVVTMALGSI